MAFRPDTSFPYLAFALEHGVDYGEVLRVSDLMQPDVKVAMSLFSGDIFALARVVVAERERRASVAPQD